MSTSHELKQLRFSQAAWDEAAEIVGEVPAVLAGRPAVKGITIDGPTSKDLDDAFWLEQHPAGGYELSISIADGGSLINSQAAPALDKEALERSFTRYLSDRNIPMLPRSLSEDRLSLLEGQLRPAITITIPLDGGLRPQADEAEITSTVLRSQKRFSYPEVDARLDQPESELAPMLQLAYVTALRLLRARKKGGALAIYDLASGWATTEEGFLRRLAEGERYKAQIITQEFMILANRAFAHFFARKGLLALYRNHQAKAIAPENRLKLLEMLETAVAHPELASPERIGETVQLVMERAEYGLAVAGHYGLNLPVYMHITSPLRRYPDLLNQRILLAALRGEPAPVGRAELEQIAAHVNQQEQAKKDASRAYFRSTYDQGIQQAIAETMQAREEALPSLAGLDAKTFHSTLRMAAESHTLIPALEQEISRRSQEMLLNAHDLFTLVFRFQNEGEDWARVKDVVLQGLQHTPYHSISMMMMGRQVLDWDEPVYSFAKSQNTAGFAVEASIKIRGQVYRSTLHVATQKELAKQLAATELLASIAGVTLEPEESEDLPEALPIPEPASEISEPDTNNYKGQLQEIAQKHRWPFPTYKEQGRSGPVHAPLFTVESKIVAAGQEYRASGTGQTKRDAGQRAAQRLLELLASQSANAEDSSEETEDK